MPPPSPPATSTGIDIGADPAVLRAIARARCAARDRGHECILVASNFSPLALNLLINLQRIKLRHWLFLGYESSTCADMSAALRGLPAGGPERLSLEAGPCLHDSWWESLLRRPKRLELNRRQGEWLIRWATFARLVRLGYDARLLLPSLTFPDLNPLTSLAFSYLLSILPVTMRCVWTWTARC